MERLLNVTTILSVLLMALVLFSVRRSHIRVEYSVSWLAAAVILLVLSRSSFALNWISRQLGLADPPLALLRLETAVRMAGASGSAAVGARSSGQRGCRRGGAWLVLPRG